MRRFNTTGICYPDEHYMVDISDRLADIEQRVSYGEYITINRGRQYGKTTTLYHLAKRLSDKYVVFSISFESMGETEFKTTETLSFAFETFIKVFSPITPFLCQEIWDVTHPGELIHDAEWQKYDENLSSLDTVTIAIQVNGKLRNTITVAKDLERNTLEGIALKTVLS